MKFVTEGLIDIKSVLVQLMAWHWLGDKLLFEPVIVLEPIVLWLEALGTISYLNWIELKVTKFAYATWEHEPPNKA